MRLCRLMTEEVGVTELLLAAVLSMVWPPSTPLYHQVETLWVTLWVGNQIL
jgi:hypothetical protein